MSQANVNPQSSSDTAGEARRRVHVIVRGRVQGVGFRYFVMRHAQRLDIAGWVRNNPDGTVELEAEGDTKALNELLRLLHDGPPMAHVQSVNATWMRATGRLPYPFTITATRW